MEGDRGGNYINMKYIFTVFLNCLFLSFRREGKKSLCAVKHSNAGAGKKGQVWYYKDFISHAIFPLNLSFFLQLCVLMVEGSWQAVIA